MVISKNTMAPWLVDEKDFPKNGSPHEQMQFLLRYAVLAPSFYNSQPWQFAINDEANQINVYANRSHWLKVADPQMRELHISLGCSLENLLVAIDYFGLGHCVAYFPESGNENWAVRVRVVSGRESVEPRPQHLFRAISRMHVYHHSYKQQPISPEHMSSIGDFLVNFKYEDSDMKHRIRLETTDHPAFRKEIGRLVSHGDAIMFANATFRRELGELLAESEYDKPWWLIPKSAKPGILNIELGEHVAEQESQIVSSAPMIGILTSNFDDATALIKIGQAYERIALEATSVGVWIYPMFQLLELLEMRNTVLNLFPGLHGHPQAVFAMGYGEQEYANVITPRIPVEDVMLYA
jgi:hypothetical protein